MVTSSHLADEALGFGWADVPWSPSPSINEPGDMGPDGLSYYS